MDKLKKIPINNKKVPAVKEWQTSEEEFELNGYGVGIVCGKLSGNLEAIDIDLKYDLTGTLFNRYKRLIEDTMPGLLKKLVVQKTTSGGYHFIYRCETIDGNKKLASRPANDAERAIGEKVKVLIETRGEGGYIAAIPTPGYSIVYGALEFISTITPEEREVLMSCAMTFNQVIKEVKVPAMKQAKVITGKTPFEDYNERGDVIGLLEKHGWEVVETKGDKILFKRPGQTTASHSGNFDRAKNWFTVFTTSSEFDPETAYLPYAVYAYLECNKDFSEASRRLSQEGYGDKQEAIQEYSSKVPTRVSELDDDYSFVAEETEYAGYLKAVREKTIEMGMTTGIPKLDEYWRFKRNQMVIELGLDNVGKTTFMLYLPLLGAIFNNFSWIIFSDENSTGYVMRRLMEFYWGVPMSSMNDSQYAAAKKFVESHFTIIKARKSLYNYKDILTMAKKLKKRKPYYGVLIDPYNALKVDMPAGYKLSEHTYHYEALSDIKLFTQTEEMSVYINAHPATEAARNFVELEVTEKNGMTSKMKFAAPPRKGDAEGGSKFSNKGDDFIVIHRYTDHPTEWMWTEVHIKKVKETESGGRPTPINAPVRLRMTMNACGFEDENQFNPIKAWHEGSGKQTPIEFEGKPLSFLTPNEEFFKKEYSEEEPPF